MIARGLSARASAKGSKAKAPSGFGACVDTFATGEKAVGSCLSNTDQRQTTWRLVKPSLARQENLKRSLPFEGEERVSGSGAEATYGMIKDCEKLFTKDNVTALMSMGEAWSIAFNDWVGRMQRHYEEQCMHLEVVDDSALSLKHSYDVGAIKTWVCMPEAYPGSQEVAFKDAEWSTLIQVIKTNLCIMIQQMLQSSISKKKGGS